MATHDRTRRDFLAHSATVAAGLVISGAVAGPAPGAIGPDKPLRFGFVGVGNRGGGLLRVVLNQPNVSVKVICDIDEDHRSKAIDLVKKRLKESPEGYAGPEDYKKMMARDDIDAVVMATPCYLHAPMYKACFAAGKHFYGEKPLSIDAGDADALVEAQKKNPRVIAQIGFQRRANPVYQEGVKRVHEGAIGPLVVGRGAFNTNIDPLGLTRQGTTSWFGLRKFSGDWMLEQACHSWDAFNWLAGGMPVAASGFGRRDLFKEQDPERDVTDHYIADLEYPNGFLLSWEHSWLSPAHDEYPGVSGGILATVGRFAGVYERVAGSKGGIELGEGIIYPRSKDDKPIKLPGAGGKIDMNDLSLKAFINSVRTGTKPISGVDNGRMATMAGLLVRKAVDERRRVLMTEIV